jgi:hypothetical protein
MACAVQNHFRAIAYGWKWLLWSGSLYFRRPVAWESVAKWKWSMVSSLRPQVLGQAEEIINCPRYYSEKQYFSRFSTRYSIEFTISRRRFLPVFQLLSLGSRFLPCWATFGCCELHKLSRSLHNSITSYWEWLRFCSQIHDWRQETDDLIPFWSHCGYDLRRQVRFWEVDGGKSRV